MNRDFMRVPRPSAVGEHARTVLLFQLLGEPDYAKWPTQVSPASWPAMPPPCTRPARTSPSGCASSCWTMPRSPPGGVDRDSAVAVRGSVSRCPVRTEDKPAEIHGTGSFTVFGSGRRPPQRGYVPMASNWTTPAKKPHCAPPPSSFLPCLPRPTTAATCRPTRCCTLRVIGYDVICEVGVLLGAAESYGRGFHPTGVAGTFGPAAAVSTLLLPTENHDDPCDRAGREPCRR